MPFTVSHAAAALVLKPLRLPLAPLVIGTMAPDLPYFIGLRHAGGMTHSFPGVLVAAAPAALALTVVWWIALRPAIRDLSPAAVRRRWHPSGPAWRSPRLWVAAVGAAAAGALTHSLWDSFTHADAWGTRAIAWLGAEQGPLPGYQWAQYLSGVVGLAAIGCALLVWWVRTGRELDSGGAEASRGTASGPSGVRVEGRARRAVLIALPFVAALVVAVVAVCFPSVPAFSFAHGFIVLTTTMGVFAGGLILMAAIWWAMARTRRS